MSTQVCPSSLGRYCIPALAASTAVAAVTVAAGTGPLMAMSRGSLRSEASSCVWAYCMRSATLRNRPKSEITPIDGPLADTAFGTPLSRSTQSRKTTEVGQLVSLRNARVSVGIGVRNRRTVSLLSAGTSVMVGRLAPLTLRSGRIEVNVRKITLLLLGLGAMKKGLASAEPASSYWVAIDETLSSKGISLYRRCTRFRSNCSSLTVRTDS